MPAKSRQQFKFFKAMEENPKLAKEHGVSPQVAHEFTDGMSKQRWSKLKKKISKD
jgi:hypothetical protein